MTKGTYWPTRWVDVSDGDDAKLFAIDIATGQLKTKKKLDRETLTADDETCATADEY